MAVTPELLTTLYLAYFGRPPDADGYAFYLAQEGATRESVLSAFVASPESRALYGPPGTDLPVLINAIYLNLFNRPAEPEGVEFWMGEVANGNHTVDSLPWAILTGAQNEDLAAVQNKLAVAQLFTTRVDTPTERTLYSGMDANESVRQFLQTVTHEADTRQYAEQHIDAAIDASMQANLNGGQSFTLVAEASSVAEGATARFRLDTIGVAPGVRFAYTITGVEAADIGGQLTGFLRVGPDRQGTVDVTLVADATTEPAPETLVMAAAGKTASVAVLDTSRDPVIPLFPGPGLVQGTSDDDIFVAINDELGPGDTVDGGGGTDTLKLFTNDAHPTPGAPVYTGITLISVERFEVTSADETAAATAGARIDLSGASGLQSLATVGGTRPVTFENVPALATLAARDVTGNQSDLRVRFADAVLAGGADTVTLELDDATLRTVQVGTMTAPGAGVETLRLVVQGSSSIGHLDVEAPTLLVSQGAHALSIGQVGSALRSVDAGSGSGALTIDIRAAAAAVAVNGGSGNDRVVVGTPGIDTVDGRAGHDTLVVTGTTVDAQYGTVQNVEALEVASTGVRTTIAGIAQAVGFRSVQLAGEDTLDAGAYTAALVVTSGAAPDTILTGSGNDTVVGGGGDNVIDGGAGNDDLRITTGFNSVMGGSGDDWIRQSGAQGPLELGGSNTLWGGAGNDVIEFDSMFANWVYGGTGDDRVIARQAESFGFYNIVQGDAGSDTIEMGAGRDVARYVRVSDSWGLASTTDVIANFGQADDDAIQLETVLVAPGITGLRFAGNAADSQEAQLAVGVASGDGIADWVYDRATQRVLVDANDDGVLNALDLSIRMANLAGDAMQADDLFILDTLPPPPPVIASVVDNAGAVTGTVASGGTTDDTTLQVSGTAEAGATVLLWIDGLLAATVVAGANGQWTVGTPALVPGAHALAAQAVDDSPSSNAGELSGAWNVTVVLLGQP